MKYKVDVVRIRENSITLNGWALGKTPESKVTFRVEDEHHQPVKCKMVSTRRDDVSQIYFKKVIDKEFGFDIQFPYERGKSYWLLIFIKAGEIVSYMVAIGCKFSACKSHGAKLCPLCCWNMRGKTSRHNGGTTISKKSF